MRGLKIAFVMMLAFAMSLPVFAQGPGGPGGGMGDMRGPGGGTGDMRGPGPGSDRPERIDVLAGTPVTVAGTVSDPVEGSRGLQVDTGTEIVAVHGIGPGRYWEEMGVDRPDVGDEVSISGYEVVFSDGSTKIIAASVAVGGTEVALIDSETGMPLWRRPPDRPDKPERPDILSGTPVTVSGIVSEIGRGLKIDTGSEIMTVYGIGPVRYWEEQEVDKPEVGDEVVIDGYEVTFSDGIARIIAMSATVNGVEIQLRDAETGLPLWPKPRR